VVLSSPGPTLDSGSPTRIGPERPPLLRTLNDEVAQRLLPERRRSSRRDMGNLIGVSKPTGSQVLSGLKAAELVRPVGVTTGRPGRAALLFEINPNAGFGTALDVVGGGSTYPPEELAR